MGRYKATAISRRLKKSVGEQTFYLLNGQNIVRMKNEENSSNTPAQALQRRLFTALGDLGWLFEDAAAIGFPARPRKHSPHNAFMKANAGVVKADEGGEVTVDYAAINCSNGRLELPKKLSVTLNSENNTLTFVHPAENFGRNRKGSDRLYAVLLEKELKETVLLELNHRSDSEPVVVTIDEEWQVENLCVYVFVLTEKGKRASMTKFIQIA